MKFNKYELCIFTNNDIEGIVELESFLWKEDKEFNEEYFVWKHQKNPLLRVPLGIVAKYNNFIVGFRGFIVTEWKLRNKTFKILSPSDTVVHPKHRRKGLFSSMTKMAMKLYQNDYKFFLNLSSNQFSTPGYLKLGWKPIGNKNYLRHINFYRLFKNIIIKEVDDNKFILGNFGDIEVTKKIYPEKISKIYNNYLIQNKIHLVKNPSFLKWKLSNIKNEYIYIYHYIKSKLDAYLILSIDKYGAHIIDYAERKNSFAINGIINFIFKKNNFSSISFLNVNLPEELILFLRRKHFYAYNIIEKVRKKKSYNLPILLRPVKKNYTEKDWFIEGVDSRNIINWKITEICSD